MGALVSLEAIIINSFLHWKLEIVGEHVKDQISSINPKVQMLGQNSIQFQYIFTPFLSSLRCDNLCMCLIVNTYTYYMVIICLVR